MNRQIRIKAKFREEPDYRKLARALIAFVERIENEKAEQPAPKKPAKPRRRAS